MLYTFVPVTAGKDLDVEMRKLSLRGVEVLKTVIPEHVPEPRPPLKRRGESGQRCGWHGWYLPGRWIPWGKFASLRGGCEWRARARFGVGGGWGYMLYPVASVHLFPILLSIIVYYLA